MKTTILNLVIPMAVVAVGLVGALTTNAMGKSGSKVAPQWGYRHVSVAIPCQQEQMCSNTGTFICTSNLNGATLYSKSGAACNEVLVRDTQ